MVIRFPTVAGMFYPSDPDEVNRMLERCFQKAPETDVPGRVIALMCPHAGYPYSGITAASAYLTLPQRSDPDTVVIIGPNHSGSGSQIAVSNADYWECMDKRIPVDTELARQIVDECSFAELDGGAHLREHSLEVQVPFLLHRLDHDFNIVPVAIGCFPNDSGLRMCLELGSALGKVLEGRNALIVASTDMSHYLTADEARRKDENALAAIRRLDAEALVEEVRNNQISMCGVMPTSAAMKAAVDMGADKAVLMDYRNSGDATGDQNHVVAYASFAFSRS